MPFQVLSQIAFVQEIANGRAIRGLRRLRRMYGGKAWRKMKGLARVRLDDASVCLGELHWYECHGVGRREIKIKRFLKES